MSGFEAQAAFGIHDPVKAGWPAGMAGGFRLWHFNRYKKAILIAIDAHVGDFLGLAAGGALMPEFAPAAGPEMGFAGGEGQIEGFAVHPGHHENGAVAGAGDNAGDQPVFIENRGEIEGFVEVCAVIFGLFVGHGCDRSCAWSQIMTGFYCFFSVFIIAVRPY
jgi:hypothetical protein